MRDEPHAGQRSIARPSSRRGKGTSRLYHGRGGRASSSRSSRSASDGVSTGAIDPEQQARAAALIYTTDATPGISRTGSIKRPRYLTPSGTPVRDAATLARIKSLVIPPAWTSVWLCPEPRGHLQVTGRDARGRKQYRYQPKWRIVRDETKFDRMLAFGYALPQVRQRVEQDLAVPGLPLPKVLATVVRLMEMTLIRVGNEEYARTNQSHGLT